MTLCALGLLLCLTPAVFGQSDEKIWPNISNPGMDLGDFPNSSFTLPQGAVQLEFAPLSIVGESQYNQPQYFTQFLFRYGVTDDLEIRLLGNGYTANYTDPQTTGFSPLALDAKVHLWDAKREWFLPASSLEVILTTDWGSRAFSNGFQPTINFNFDLPLTESLNLEWTVGVSGVLETVVTCSPGGAVVIDEQNVNQAAFSWAFEQNLTPAWQVFVTGETLETVAGQIAGTTLACGGSWAACQRLMYFGLIGWGVTPEAPKIAAQVGFGIALGPAQTD